MLDAGRVLYVGTLGAMPDHRAWASALLVGIERPFTLRIGGHERSQRVAPVPTQTVHAVDFHNARAAVLFVDPGIEPAFAVADDSALIDAIEQVLSRPGGAQPDGAQAWHALWRCASGTRETVEPDPRIAAVARRLIESSDESLSAAELAAGAHLSVSRLEHLFKAQMGVPLGAFRSWHRFRLAARHLLDGSTITEAAHAAGFHDSAHFSHAFSDAFGMPPSHVFTPMLTGRCLD